MNGTTIVEPTTRTYSMGDLIGLPEAAEILGMTRMNAWLMYSRGQLQALMVIGTEKRPRPLFSRAYIEKVAKERAAAKAGKA